MQITKLKSLIEENQNGAGQFVVVEGLHAVKHALRFNAKPEIILTKNKENLIKLSKKLCPDIIPKLNSAVELEEFDQLTNSKIRTEILGIFHKSLAPSTFKSLPRTRSGGKGWGEGLKILLDNPKDLNNIGAVIRVCAAAGIKDLIITGESNAWNSRAIRAGAGLQFALNIHQIPTYVIPSEALAESKDLCLISFDERGQELDAKLKKQIPKDSILIFGSERDGISEELKLKSDLVVRLPMQEGVSSLNLATSVAAALYSLK